MGAGDVRLISASPALPCHRYMVLVSLGERGSLSSKKWLDVVQKTIQVIIEYRMASIYQTLHWVELDDGTDHPRQLRLLFELTAKLLHRLDAYKSEKNPSYELQRICWHGGKVNKELLDAMQKASVTAQAVAYGVGFARSLADAPANLCTPSDLAKQVKDLEQYHAELLQVDVLDQTEIQSLGMRALLSVAKGSDEPPKLIVAHYHGAEDPEAKPYVLVGKGITFDSGGISLKPREGMDDMKYDMGGAAAVLGCLRSVLELHLPINLKVVVPACENMPSARASKPGDVITSMSGKTIEILNTDAEGRLILSDALTYVERFNPRLVIDVATLTGACIVALGHVASGMYSNREELYASLFKDAGEYTMDYAWPMPMYEMYQDNIKGKYADIANINTSNTSGAGSVGAACFLSRFTQAYPWVHLDVAGTAMPSGSLRSGTGRPVPLLIEVLCRLLQQHSE